MGVGDSSQVNTWGGTPLDDNEQSFAQLQESTSLATSVSRLISLRIRQLSAVSSEMREANDSAGFRL